MVNQFSRKCPKCSKLIYYTTRRGMRDANRNNSFCEKCRPQKKGIIEKKFFRECPICKKQLGYTIKKARNKAEKLKTICGKCRSKEVQNRDYTRKNKSEKLSKFYETHYSSFYGKHHTKASIEKIKEGNKNRDRSFITKEFLEKSRKPGKLNGMYGRTFYDAWLKRYGKVEADKKMMDYKNKMSKLLSGKNNPMYGRPAPIGSGNGWSGWYKNWYFRSLRELSYMINVIEKKNYKWQTAESKDLYIPYTDYDGHNRLYRADFFVNDKLLIEIKPEKLMMCPNNQIKKKAAIRFCKKHGYEYRMIDIKIIDRQELMDLYQNKIVQFTKKYQKIMEKMLCKLAKNKK